MTIHLLLMLIALILFVVAALGVSSGRINLTAAGLAFLVASMLILGGCDSPRDEDAENQAIAVDNSPAQTNTDECPRADGQPCR